MKRQELANNYRMAGWYSPYLPEAILWLAGLLAMSLMQPEGEHLFSFCPFSYLVSWCPGCGLGHAVAWLARGDIAASWQAHPLGVPAVAALLGRVLQLVRKHFIFKRSL